MTRYTATALPATAERFGVDLPRPVRDALGALHDVRAINPNPRPLADFARPILSVAPTKREKALADGIAAHAAERDRPAFVRAVIDEAGRAVDVAVREARDEIVSAFFAAPTILEAGQVIAEQAPKVPVDTPRNPSLEMTTPSVVGSVAAITGAWQVLGRLLADLDALLPGVDSAHIGVGLLAAEIDFTSEEQTWAIVHALAGRRDGAVSSFAASIPGISEHARRDGERIPAVALAYVPGVTLALPTTREEYAQRIAALASATRPGRWRPIVQQTHSESWVINV